MRILALDLGDKWVGTAISDEIGITCRPYKTVSLNELKIFLEKILFEENINTVIVGYPKTIKGTSSLQTQKTIEEKNKLEKQFKKINNVNIDWILWDERLSSKRAEKISNKRYKNKTEKLNSHSVAAAFILQSYLDNLALYRS